MKLNTKAAVLFETGTPLKIIDVSLDGPKEGEVRVRMLAAGICQSDWHCMNGDWPAPLPLIPGHEGCGVVEEIGKGVTGLATGDRVILSFTPQCGGCPSCTSGRPVLCTGYASAPAGTMPDGTLRAHYLDQPVYQMARVGCFSERVVVPAAQVVAIRNDMPAAPAALVSCSVTTGIGAVTRHAGVGFGDTVVVIGCGGVGLNVVQGARSSGAKTIVACDIKDGKLKLAASFGATHVLNSAEEKLVERIHGLTAGGADYCFDTVCIGQTMSAALEIIRPGGRVVAVGIPSHKESASFSPRSLVLREKTISGALYGSSRPRVDFPTIVDLYMSGAINIDGLISKTYTLDQINDGFAAMLNGEVARGVIMFPE